ncbi:MAG: 4Fe-4S binding protein [Bacillota bacterium]|nr:4Fe-4S binding protein [Bacillota bacterium]
MYIDTEKCTGCRSCELACSMHHYGCFNPVRSSIQVAARGRSFQIKVFKDENEGRPPCDNCTGETERMCIKYCTSFVRDELAAIINR